MKRVKKTNNNKRKKRTNGKVQKLTPLPGYKKYTVSRKGMGGVPTIYDDSLPERVYNLCLLKLTDKEIAEHLGIRPALLQSWKRKQPEFAAALQNGRDYADAKVARSLYERAVGYTVLEDRVFFHKGMNAPAVVQVMKHYPPSEAAIDMWLRNRQRDRWGLLGKVELTGKDGAPIQFQALMANLKDFSDDELALMESTGLKKLKEKDGSNGNQ